MRLCFEKYALKATFSSPFLGDGGMTADPYQLYVLFISSESEIHQYQNIASINCQWRE